MLYYLVHFLGVTPEYVGPQHKGKGMETDAFVIILN